jgi:hypothetical protein
MRVMRSPWGMALAVVAGVLTLLLIVSAISALFALTGFLVHRSRWPAPTTVLR